MSNRIEFVAGVCPLIYKECEHTQVLITRELTAKEATGKLAGMWGLGYETVEEKDGIVETHQEAIARYFQEELKVTKGEVYLPQDLDKAKICIVRISPPEMAAWVHVYPCPVSGDFEAEPGDFKDEVGQPLWIDLNKILAAERGSRRILFRAGTYEIIEEHVIRQEVTKRGVRIYHNPKNLPPWQIYRLMEQGFSQTEALSRLGVDPKPLLDSQVLIHSL